MDSTTPDIDDLATLLFSLPTERLTTDAVTALLTHEIAGWAVMRGWTPRREARVVLPTMAEREVDLRLGYIDLVISRGGRDPDLAIEIDSTQKPWSLAKLRYAVAAGMHGIWVRWGATDWAGVYDDVDVIQLWTVKRALPRPRATSQLTLWS